MRRAAWGLAALCLSSAALAQPSPRALPALPLWITIAEVDGQSVVTDAWIDAQIANAGALFAPHGVTFREVARERMGAEHARLETRRDRHALGALVHANRAIDWFVVASLRDVDDPSRYRQGVHWRPRPGPPGAHFVITSSIAGEHVLAHELGHYFGNGHSDVPGNIMSYERGDQPPFFDDDQSRRIRASARRFLARGELVPADQLRGTR